MKYIVTYPERTGETAWFMWDRLRIIRASATARKEQASKDDIRWWLRRDMPNESLEWLRS